jgi:hypothetical protein
MSSQFKMYEGTLRSANVTIKNRISAIGDVAEQANSKIKSISDDIWQGTQKNVIIQSFTSTNGGYIEYANGLSAISNFVNDAIAAYKKADSNIASKIGDDGTTSNSNNNNGTNNTGLSTCPKCNQNTLNGDKCTNPECPSNVTVSEPNSPTSEEADNNTPNGESVTNPEVSTGETPAANTEIPSEGLPTTDTELPPEETPIGLDDSFEGLPDTLDDPIEELSANTGGIGTTSI